MKVSDKQRLVPRYPLPKEKAKFFFEEGEKVFALRDISLKGIGINFLEHNEVLFFPLGYHCKAELKLDDHSFLVDLKVARSSAWAAGFTFENLAHDLETKIIAIIDPLRIARSLRPVDPKAKPEGFFQGISSWYHGDSSTDLYFWHDTRGGLERALLLLGEDFWEWSLQEGIRTGRLERLQGDNAELRYDQSRQNRLHYKAQKILEHAESLDYRLVNFLQQQIGS